MSIKIERYKNNHKKSFGYQKFYGRIVHQKKVVDIRRLAEHIQAHGSIYTYDTIIGVLAKMEMCIPELLSQGYKVKLDGLGTLKLHAQSKGEETVTDWTPQKDIKKLRVRFAPEQSDFSLVRSDAVTRSGSSEGFELLNYVVEKVVNGERVITYLDGESNGGSGGSTGGTGGSGGSNSGQEQAGEDRP